MTGVPGGQGTITFPSGSMYVGGFRDGKRTGQGIMNYSHGGKYVGEFYGGDPWNAVEYNKDGNIIGKWMNGVRQ